MLKKEIKNKKLAVFVIGALIGLLVFAFIYGMDVVKFTNDSFLSNGYIEKDIEQHYTGWILYRNSPFTFPFGVGEKMAYPYGSSVSYTDSIPLFAIFFKMFRGILPQTFQYFGLFVMLCFMLQGAFGGMIASLFSESIVVSALTSALFCFSPVMVERAFRHCALTAHFLILAALYYYFKNKGQTDFKSVVPFIVINALSITIHPYFMPFTFGVMFAFCLEMFFSKKEYTKSVLYLVASIALTLFIGWVIGAFYIKGALGGIGYGIFSMNLNSFFNPASIGIENWSKTVGQRPLYYMWQIEGFNYLGLGVLIFCPAAAILLIIALKTEIFKAISDFIKNNFGLLFSALALFVFATGDWLTFGGLKIIRYPFSRKMMDGLFGIFRANGRFGWIIVYLILIFIVYCVATCKNKYLSALLMAVLCCVQVWDMGDVISSKSAYFKGQDGDLQAQVTKNRLHSRFWDMAADRYDCVFMYEYGMSTANVDLANLFAKHGKSAHTDFRARVDEEKSEIMLSGNIRDIADGKLNDSYILVASDIVDKMKNALDEGHSDVYLVDGLYVICNSKFSDEELTLLSASGNFEVVEKIEVTKTFD